MNKPIRVLVVGMTDTAGGVENFLMSYCSRIDPKRIRFDFLTQYAGAAYADLRNALGTTYCMPLEDPVQYHHQLRAFFAAHAREYDVLWDNECLFDDLMPLKLAAEHGIPVRIAHSHNPQNVDPSLAGKSKGALHRMQRRTLSHYANVLWASSEASARWACPAMDLPVSIIPHAVDAEKFRFRSDVRAEVRAHYGLENCLVVGQVGRLHYQKNDAFLLDVFARLYQREPRARLMLVGDGPDLLTLEARAVDLGVSDAVLFLGHRDDVPRLLQAFDVFAMPSRVEGLGMAAVEAQAAGLPCVLSTACPKDAALTDRVTFLPPEDPDLWAERLLDVLESTSDRGDRDPIRDITRAGYELSEAAQRLTQRIERLVQERSAFRRRFLLADTAAGEDPSREAFARIARDAGFAVTNITTRPAQTLWQRIWSDACLAAAWVKLFAKLHHGDLLLVQYPWQPARTAHMARWALHMLQWKGAKTAAYIHELESVCDLEDAHARWSDQELLASFDRLIVHNERMANYLRAQGAQAEQMIAADLPDHAAEGAMPMRTMGDGLCVLDAEMTVPGIECHPAGALDAPLRGAFGLVWPGRHVRPDGTDATRAMLHTPAEIGRFLAQGMPVVVWKWSAAAETVRAQKLGIAVETLADIPARLNALTDAEYADMARAAQDAGALIREGEMTRRALDQLK